MSEPLFYILFADEYEIYAIFILLNPQKRFIQSSGMGLAKPIIIYMCRKLGHLDCISRKIRIFVLPKGSKVLPYVAFQ